MEKKNRRGGGFDPTFFLSLLDVFNQSYRQNLSTSTNLIIQQGTTEPHNMLKEPD